MSKRSVWLAASLFFLSPGAVLAATPCLTDAEISEEVAAQLGEGASFVDKSVFGSRMPCSGLPLPQAIQKAAARLDGEPEPKAVVQRPDPPIPSGPPGRISGEFSYPSDYMPDDIQACAEEVVSGRETCSGKATARAGRWTYSLSLPPARYNVYARTADAPGKKAYYTTSVVCGGGAGGEANCTDHTPVIVIVRSGDKLTGINPQDWYTGEWE